MEVKKVAQVDEVKLIALSHLERGPDPRNILQDFLYVFFIPRPFETLCLLDFNVHHLDEMIGFLLNFLISGTLVLLDIDLCKECLSYPLEC